MIIPLMILKNHTIIELYLRLFYEMKLISSVHNDDVNRETYLQTLMLRQHHLLFLSRQE